MKKTKRTPRGSPLALHIARRLLLAGLTEYADRVAPTIDAAIREHEKIVRREKKGK